MKRHCVASKAKLVGIILAKKWRVCHAMAMDWSGLVLVWFSSMQCNGHGWMALAFLAYLRTCFSTYLPALSDCLLEPDAESELELELELEYFKLAVKGMDF